MFTVFLNKVIWQGKQFYSTFYHYSFLAIYPNSKAMFTRSENERKGDFALEWVSYLFAGEICFYNPAVTSEKSDKCESIKSF